MANASVILTVPVSNTIWTIIMFAERMGRSIQDTADVSAMSRGSSKL